MAARSLAVRNNLRSNNIYLKNRDFVEYATNFKVYKKAKVREVVDRIRLVESDFKSAKQIITDRKNGGRNSLYENARKNIEVVAKKIKDALNSIEYIDGHKNISTPSIGVTLFNDDSVEVKDIIKQADTAMYVAKKHGKNCIEFFS